MLNAFKMADEVLLQGVQGITDLITTPGLINTDFADVKMIITNAGSALMGVGYASGDGRAVAAARAAISSPLLEASIEGARGILLNISGPSDLGLFEVNEAAEIIAQAAHPDANIIFGAVIDDALGDEVRITVIAAGFDRFEGEQRDAAGLRARSALGLDDDGLARRRRARASATTTSTSPSSCADRRLRRTRDVRDRRGSGRRGSGAPTGTAACRRRRTTRATSATTSATTRPRSREPRARRGRRPGSSSRRGGCGSVRCTAPRVHVATGADRSGAARGRRRGHRDVPGLPLAVLTADCAPIALACDDAVGVVHAGHRGLEHGVIEAAVARAARDRARAGAARISVRASAPRTTSSAPTISRASSRARPRGRGPHARRPARARHPRRASASRCEACGVDAFDDAGVCTVDVGRTTSRTGATASPDARRRRGARRDRRRRRRASAEVTRAHRGRGAARRARRRRRSRSSRCRRRSTSTRSRAALAAGQRDFGENRAQELAGEGGRAGARRRAPTRAVWHFIGRLQRNKVQGSRRGSRCGSRWTASSSARRSRGARPARGCSCR